MEQEDAIVVNPPQELETNNESETVQVDGPRGTASARTGTEPQEQRTYTFTKHDIKAIADEALQEAIDKGEFDDIVEANPTIEGSEPDLESLKVGSTKYKVGGGTEVIANPTLAGTEAILEGLQIGNTKYKAGGGPKRYLYQLEYSDYQQKKTTFIATSLIGNTKEDFAAYLYSKGHIQRDSALPLFGPSVQFFSGGSQTSSIYAVVGAFSTDGVFPSLVEEGYSLPTAGSWTNVLAAKVLNSGFTFVGLTLIEEL